MNKLKDQDKQDVVVEKLVVRERKLQQRIGGKKLYRLLKPEMEQLELSMGRDKFFRFLRKNRLLVPKSKNFTITTNSFHHFFKHPNRIQNMELTKPEQVWVSDITYIKTQKENLYLSLITDAFSKRIMGYHLADHLRTDGPLQALHMALRNRMYPNRKLIHHSDRGFQYCNPKYTDVLDKNKIKISMTTKYHPYENAVAERVNGTIKNEMIVLEILPPDLFAHKSVKQSIETYNTRRPHLSLHYRTPIEAHSNPNFKLKKWKKNFRKKTNTRQGIN
jgi:putative transposase